MQSPFVIGFQEKVLLLLAIQTKLATIRCIGNVDIQKRGSGNKKKEIDEMRWNHPKPTASKLTEIGLVRCRPTTLTRSDQSKGPRLILQLTLPF
jgi:hypothetical protein